MTSSLPSRAARSDARVHVRANARADARRLFGVERGLRARLQEWRPLICPIDEVLAWIPAHASVLDIGCGAGLLPGLLALRRSTSTLTADAPPILGVDASVGAIAAAQALARRLAAGAGDGLPTAPPDFMVTTSVAQWPRGPMGAVMMVDVLHHIPPDAQLAFVQEALARVAPGGRFVYKDMARRPWLHAVANRMHDLLLARQWIHYVEPVVVISAAVQAGLVLVHRAHHRRWWYAHDLLVFERPAVPSSAPPSALLRHPPS